MYLASLFHNQDNKLLHRSTTAITGLNPILQSPTAVPLRLRLHHTPVALQALQNPPASDCQPDREAESGILAVETGNLVATHQEAETAFRSEA